MHPNEELLHNFYTAFQEKNVEGMIACYSEEVLFSDPVFPHLEYKEVCAMWAMLLERGKDLVVEFDQIEAHDFAGSAQWKATYTFGPTGKKVLNQVRAEFEFHNGEIVIHNDIFPFHTWARQALGPLGRFLGRLPFLLNRTREMADKSLQAYLQEHA